MCVSLTCMHQSERQHVTSALVPSSQEIKIEVCSTAYFERPNAKLSGVA
jgi:hypothetical protein